MSYLNEDLDYPYFMVKDRIAKPARKLSQASGQGTILRRNGRRMAVYRKDDGYWIVKDGYPGAAGRCSGARRTEQKTVGAR